MEHLYDYAVMRPNISSEQWELWIAPRRFNFAGADLGKKTWLGFWFFNFFCNEICMSYLVHVWFDAAYKKRIGGTQSGHEGMQRVLKHISNKTLKIKKADKLALLSLFFIYLCMYFSPCGQNIKRTRVVLKSKISYSVLYFYLLLLFIIVISSNNNYYY